MLDQCPGSQVGHSYYVPDTQDIRPTNTHWLLPDTCCCHIMEHSKWDLELTINIIISSKGYFLYVDTSLKYQKPLHVLTFWQIHSCPDCHMEHSGNLLHQPCALSVTFIHTVPGWKKITSHETSKRVALGDRYWSPRSGNGRQENIGWENFAQLTKTFAKLIQENNFLKIAKSRQIYVFAAILTW